jgi:hypothetical protein
MCRRHSNLIDRTNRWRAVRRSGLGSRGRHNDVMRNRIGRVAQCRVDVFMRQARVRINEVGFRRRLRQLAKNGLDWNARTPDHLGETDRPGLHLRSTRFAWCRHAARL